jgi:hypothetical protein
MPAAGDSAMNRVAEGGAARWATVDGVCGVCQRGEQTLN